MPDNEEIGNCNICNKKIPKTAHWYPTCAKCMCNIICKEVDETFDAMDRRDINAR